MFIIKIVYIARPNIPFLFERIVLDKYNCLVNKMKNMLCCAKLNIEIPLEQKHGHTHLPWNRGTKVLHTGQEFFSVHKTFSYST